MTRKSRGYTRSNSWNSSRPTITLNTFSHIPPIQNEPASFSQQKKLFSDNKERSWVEFIAAREKLPESSIDLETLREKRSEDVREEWPEKIKEEGTLWEIAEHRDNNPIHVFFIRQKNSNSSLLLTRSLFEALISSNGVFGAFKDFVLSFGWKIRELDIGPPHCRFQRSNPEEFISSNYRFPNLECAYGIRYVELNGHGPNKEPWSVRQTALYQKYKEGKQTWILISPSKDFQAKFETYIQRFSNNNGGNQPENPFELHSILIACALKKWRWYIQSLVKRATEQSSKVVAANVGEGKRGAIDININFEDRQNLKVVEDKVLDLFTIFDSAIDTIQTISQEYQSIAQNVDWNPDRIASSLKESLREVELYRKKADTLHKTVQGTASLLSDLLDNENAKIAEENGKNLAILARESREENSVMRKLTEKGTSDAAAVKVITLITIIFLPTTVVAGVFSTQFVKQSADGNKLELTENWWLIVAIALPLTCITILVWYCWVRWQQGRRFCWGRDTDVEDGRRSASEACQLDELSRNSDQLVPSTESAHHLEGYSCPG